MESAPTLRFLESCGVECFPGAAPVKSVSADEYQLSFAGDNEVDLLYMPRCGPRNHSGGGSGFGFRIQSGRADDSNGTDLPMLNQVGDCSGVLR